MTLDTLHIEVNELVEQLELTELSLRKCENELATLRMENTLLRMILITVAAEYKPNEKLGHDYWNT